jgi:hypothetical protein
MKVTRIALLGCCMAMAMSASALAATIASWTFETSIPTTAGPHAAEVGTGSALGAHAGASTYSNPVGNGTAESFSSTNWVVGDYYQFSTSTLGFDTLSFSIDHTSSGTGPKDFKFSASTDGSTFTDIGTYSVLANSSPNSWSSSVYLANGTYTTSLPAALNNQAAIYVRVVQTTTTSANGGTVASGGTSRVDSVVVSGTEVPEPATLGLVLVSVGAMLFRRK